MTFRAATRARRALLALLVTATAFATACTDTREQPAGRGNVRAVHALADVGEVQFQIEARVLDTPNYQETTNFFAYDSLTYDFNFDYNSGATGQVERLATTSIDVTPDTDYTLFLTGTAQSPRIVTFVQDSFEPSGSTDTLLAWGVNLSQTAGDIDLYIGAPGLDPTAVAASAGGVGADQIVAIGDIAAGEVQVVATPAGQPGTELIRTEPTNLLADDRLFVSLFDSAGDSTAPYVVVLTSELGTARLVDDAAPVRLQFGHFAPTEAAVDVYAEPAEAALTTPLFGGVGFGTVTDPVDLPAADDVGEVTVTVTPAGNAGVVLAEQPSAYRDGATSLQIVAGAQSDDSLRVVTLQNSRRPVADAARVSLYNAIREQERVDIYLLEPGQTFDRATSRPVLNDAAFGQPLSQLRTPPGTYTAVIVRQADEAVLLAPTDVVLEPGDVIQFVTTDTADPNASALLEIDLTGF